MKRLQLKFGLRWLFAAVAIVPLLFWGAFQYRQRQLRAQAQERLLQTARTSASEPIEYHLCFEAGDSFGSLRLGLQPDPQQLLADSRRAGMRIHRISLADDCLVDIALARQIAAVPNLVELSIGAGTQIEPAAYPILFGATEELVISSDCLQAIRAHDQRIPPPKHLFLYQLPVAEDEFLTCLQAAVAWQPKSIYLNHQVPSAQREALLGEGTPLRTELTRLQLANPQMLISLSGLEFADGGTAPVYSWKTPELKAMYERMIRADLPRDEAAQLYDQLLAQEPNAWPLLEGPVYDDYGAGDFSTAAEARARKLLQVAPWHLLAHFNIGLAQYRRGELDKAIESLEEARLRARLQMGEFFDFASMSSLAVRYQAAAHVAAGRRTEGLRVLERYLADYRREDRRFAAVLLTAVWICCTSPQATAEDANTGLSHVTYAALLQTESSEITFFSIPVDCLRRDFAAAQTHYDLLAKDQSPNVKPRFRAEFKRLGECIQQRKRFVTDYVPVNAFWD